jgi:phosphoribosylformylglycinamidine cyclo-ligase
VDADEMYRVFNMGIGYVLILRERDAGMALRALRAARSAPVVIGRIQAGVKKVLMTD